LIGELPTSDDYCRLIASLFVILLQIKLTKLEFFSAKKKDMNTDKPAINWQNFVKVRSTSAQVWFFTRIIWPKTGTD